MLKTKLKKGYFNKRAVGAHTGVSARWRVGSRSASRTQNFKFKIFDGEID